MARTSTVHTPYGYTIFCDDIRPEMGGKFSFVGCYREDLIVHGNFPFVLPKFGLAVSYWEQPGDRSDKVKLQVYLPGDPDDHPSGESELPIEEARNTRSLQPPSEGGERFIRLDLNIILAPLVLKTSGLIKVRAVCGDEVFQLGSLRVVQQESTDAIPPPILPPSQA